MHPFNSLPFSHCLPTHTFNFTLLSWLVLPSHPRRYGALLPFRCSPPQQPSQGLHPPSGLPFLLLCPYLLLPCFLINSSLVRINALKWLPVGLKNHLLTLNQSPYSSLNDTLICQFYTSFSFRIHYELPPYKISSRFRDQML